jgi:hypothetical protein
MGSGESGLVNSCELVVSDPLKETAKGLSPHRQQDDADDMTAMIAATWIGRLKAISHSPFGELSEKDIPIVLDISRFLQVVDPVVKHLAFSLLKDLRAQSTLLGGESR